MFQCARLRGAQVKRPEGGKASTSRQDQPESVAGARTALSAPEAVPAGNSALSFGPSGVVAPPVSTEADL